MRVPVGSRTYELKVVQGKLVLNGRTCASLCDHDRLQILISDVVPLAYRMDVAALAVSEAWKHRSPTLTPILGPVT